MMNSNTRLAASSAAIALALLALTGCAPGASGSPDGEGGSLTHVRFALPTAMGANNAPLAVAAELGYFEEEGLDVEIINTNDSASIVQGIDAGSLEIGSTPPEPILQAITQGSELELTYNYLRQQTGSIAVLADGPIASISDLEGGVIGQASLGISNMLLSNGILASEGLEENADFSNLAVGTGAAALQALTEGHVDALSLWDTEYAAFEAEGVELRYLTTDEVQSLFSTTFFAAPAYAAEHPEVMIGFGRAMAKATLFTATNPEAALRLLYAGFPDSRVAGASEDEQLEKDLIALERRVEVLTAQDPQQNGTWGAYTPESLEAWTGFALESGVIDTPVDPSTLAQNAFVEEYNAFDSEAVIRAANDWTGA